MSDTMGTFRIEVEFAKPTMQGRRALLQGVLVDTGSELSWFPGAVLELLGIERAEHRLPAGERNHRHTLRRVRHHLLRQER